MSAIFKNAGLVVVWLGVSSDVAMRILQKSVPGLTLEMEEVATFPHALFSLPTTILEATLGLTITWACTEYSAHVR
jgi:uncharacterized membrane protein SpoIIM required for sporulation